MGGFVIELLAAQGWQVSVAARRPKKIRASSQVEFIKADIHDEASVARAVQGADAVINLTGILSAYEGQDFDSVHRRGALRIAEAARKAGVDKLIHLSAIGADSASSSLYARSKGEGEAAILAVFPAAVIFRPSIIFGPGDGFFCRFAAMARVSPFLPLIGGGASLFQPVFAGDVALAMEAALAGKAKPGTIYECGGPRRYSFAQLLRFLCATCGKKRLLLPIPYPAANLLAFFIEAAAGILGRFFPPLFLITRDQIKLLKRNNIVSAEAEKEGRTLPALGIAPRSIEEIVPAYLA